MRALTIKQPWASLIIAGEKTAEFRSWATKRRGPIAIHAGASIDPRASSCPITAAAMRRAGLEWDSLPLGGIIGTVNISDCVPVGRRHKRIPGYPGNGYAFMLSDPQPIPFRPMRGALSFWKVL
jgi:hypothetical protein